MIFHEYTGLYAEVSPPQKIGGGGAQNAAVVLYRNAHEALRMIHIYRIFLHETPFFVRACFDIHAFISQVDLYIPSNIELRPQPAHASIFHVCDFLLSGCRNHCRHTRSPAAVSPPWRSPACASPNNVFHVSIASSQINVAVV